MIPRNKQTLQMPRWQNQLSGTIKTTESLIDALKLPAESLTSIQPAHDLFPIRVPQRIIDKIEPGNPDDPLLKQFVPDIRENQKAPEYSCDPVGDGQSEKVPGLLHKYQGRVLLTVTGACGIHCRYCFRRHFDYSNSNPGKHNWQAALDYIRNDDSIFEVILSGGDPLSLSDLKLSKLVEEISSIPHIRLLRVHTRQILIIPDRVNKELLSWIEATRLKCTFVLHCNHPSELDDDTFYACKQLKRADVELLNQSVLLKDVNNNPDTLAKLSISLYESGIQPYYLHLLDKVEGAAHFDVNESDAVQIINKLRQQLPGYLVPKLVREIAGKEFKIPVG